MKNIDMKRAVRAGGLIDYSFSGYSAHYPPISQGVCWQCRRQAAASHRAKARVTHQTFASRRYASSSISSRLSSKIFGSAPKDTPKEPSQGPIEDVEISREEAMLEEDTEPSFTVDPQDKSADYVTASSAHGLPHSTDMLRKKVTPKPRYRSFMREGHLASSQLDGAVHRALVEVYTLIEAGLAPIVMTASENGEFTSIGHTRVSQGKEGHVSIEWDDSDMRGRLVHALSTPSTSVEQPDVEQDEGENEDDLLIEPELLAEDDRSTGVHVQDSAMSMPDPKLEPAQDEMEKRIDEMESTSAGEDASEEPQELSRETHEDLIIGNEPSNIIKSLSGKLEPWRGIRFDDSDVKFAVLKRVMQLTGIRIPDPAIQSIKDVRTLLAQLHEKPKPKKLAQVLMVNEQLQRLPNVQVKETRYTPIHKEKELGRWKVIVEELKKRDLPVLGTMPPSDVEELLRHEMSTSERERLSRQLDG